VPSPLLLPMAAAGRHRTFPNNLAYVKETTFTESSAATSATFTPGNTAGDLLVVCIGNHSSSGTHTVSNCGSPGSNVDPGGNTWTKAASSTTATIYELELWYSLTTAIAGLVTVTFSGSTASLVSCQEWSGANATPLDVTKAGTGGSGTSPTTGTSAATGSASEVVIGWIFSGGTVTYSAQTTGYTPLTMLSSPVSGQLASGQSAYRLLSAAGTQSYGATISSSVTWDALLATFKSS